MSDEKRIENLEMLVRALARDVEALRAELRGSRPALPADAPSPLVAARPVMPPAPPAAPSAPRPGPAPAVRPAAAPRRSGVDIEALVGRYGTIVVAAFTILMGVGAFLSWAIANARLGPEARVALGAGGAVALAAVGAWLRRRGSRRFGGVVLALALAVAHVVAWGAGPHLHVLPASVALVLAAAASLALAALALHAEEESLFVVGVGGAFLAPFVTSDGGGSGAVLLTYGWLVLTAGAAAVRERRWRAGNLVLGAACSAYVFAGLAVADRLPGSSLGEHAPLLFALACAWSALLLDRGVQLAVLLRAALGAGALAAFVLAELHSAPLLRWLALAGAGTAYARRLRVAHAADGAPAEAVAIPLAYLAAALWSLDEATSLAGALLAFAWAVLAAAMAWRAGAERDELHAMVAGLASSLALFLALDDRPTVRSVALAGHGALLVAVMRRLGVRLVALPAIGALLVATLLAFVSLDARAPWGYTPFLTLPSLVTLLVVAGWVLAGACTTVAIAPGRPVIGDRAHWWAAAAVVALLWGRAELVTAYTADIANFLLIAWYATAGVAAIAVGRHRGIAPVRQVGLALAVYADLKAVFQASEISSIGLRVGSYLLSGFFLLAVGYWAWSSAEEQPAPSRPAPEPPLADGAVSPHRSS